MNKDHHKNTPATPDSPAGGAWIFTEEPPAGTFDKDGRLTANGAKWVRDNGLDVSSYVVGKETEDGDTP